MTWFLIFSIKPTPLVHHSIPQSQALNLGLIHLNNAPPTRFQVLPHVVRQNRALAAQLFIYSLKLTPLASHLIVWANSGESRLRLKPPRKAFDRWLVCNDTLNGCWDRIETIWWYYIILPSYWYLKYIATWKTYNVSLVHYSFRVQIWSTTYALC